MWIATLDIMCHPTLEWCPDEQTGPKKKTAVVGGLEGIGVVGDYERLSL